MSVTFPAAYSAKLHSSTLDVDWLFHFVNDNAGVVYLSSKDRTVGSNRYYGVIEDPGEITRELDLINCVASIGEISISCADHYKTDTLSGELLHNGTDYYINQQVLIYECANDETTLANCPKLYEGRLKEIDIQGNSVVLVIEQWTPFDHIMIPTTKSTSENILVPIVYGHFDGNAPGALCTNKNLYPIPWIYDQGYYRYFAMPKAVTGTDEVFPHYYDSANDIFEPIGLAAAGQLTATIDGVDSVFSWAAIVRHFKIYPTSVHADNEWPTDPEKAINASTGDYAQTTDYEYEGVGGGGQYEEYLELSMPPIEGEITEFKVHIDADIDLHTVTGTPDSPYYLDLSIVQDLDVTEVLHVEDTDGTATTTGYDEHDLTAGLTDAMLSEKLRIRCRWYMESADGAIEGWGRVNDVYIEIKTSRAIADADPTHGVVFNKMDTVYIGDTDTTGAGDGIERDYTDGDGNPAEEVHEIHRDIMDRYAGVDFDNDYMLNWSDLDTARGSWKARLWLLEPIELKSILDQLQFEGCFIFMFVADSDGSGTSGGRYIWVKDSYVNGDFPATDGDPVLQVYDEDDYTNFSVGHTDVFEVITRTKYDYNKNPASGKYLQEEDYNNTTDRDNWNLSTSHFEEIALDFLTECTNGTDDIYDSGSGDNTANESIVLYRDNLQSEPKILVDCEITNKKKSNVEYGDIVQFNDSNVNPYGESWANLFFMVISERRSKTGLSITAREVYRT